MEKLGKEEDIQVDERSTSYTLSNINRRKALAEAKLEGFRKTILKAMEYYNLEYPKSTRNIEWTQPKVKISVDLGDDVDEFLGKCSEKELFGLREIIEYTRRETLRKVSEHEQYQLTGAYIKKMIPGIVYIEQLEDIKEKESEILREKAKYEKLIAEERRMFNEVKVEVIEEIKVPEDDSENLEPYWCSMCARTHIKGNIYQEHLENKV